MNASDDLHSVTEVTEALRLLAVCRDRLEDLNAALGRGQWQQASVIAGDYSSLLGGMTDIDASAPVLTEMVQLEIMHRRCMRHLSRQMAVVAENIATLTAGKQAALRSREMAATIYRQ